MMDLRAALSVCPVIAILRGVTPAEAPAVGAAVFEAGIRIVEVPLNSPAPLNSIRRLAEIYGASMLVGAGTVLQATEVEEVAAAGGRLIVSPNVDAAVVRAAKQRGLIAVPGVATPTEAFAALAAGAEGLKLFPAEMIGPPVVKALRAVLPPDTLVIPVGGVSAATIPAFRAAGANGFGLGSQLYAPGKSPAAVKASAMEIVAVTAT
jgi:2-dehydro-3-deoxyphosphogalactonate aldolase